MTTTTTGKGKKGKRREGFLDWLVKIFKPGYHLAKNPPKGVKKTKKYETKGE